MAAIFADSCDHYSIISQKWDSGGAPNNINTNPLFVRTGTQSISANAGAFEQLPRKNFSAKTTLISGYGYYQSLNIGGFLQHFYDQPTDTKSSLKIGADGAVLIFTNGVQLGPASAANTIGTGAYYYVECKWKFSRGVDGLVQVKVNGQTVLTFTGDNGATQATAFMITGQADNDAFYDDIYLCDDTGGVNNDFQGAVRIYAIPPDANEAPLQWTPLSGTNFSEVNQIPPPGDSSYVSTNTPGNIDQYHFTPAIPPSTYFIKWVQSCIDARLDDAGSHQIAAQCNGTSGASQAVAGNYKYSLQEWDTNPNTGVAFVPADFATTWFGQKLIS